MSDVVQRLRDGLEDGAVDIADIMDAADAIERLNREVSALIAECQQQKVLLVNGATLTDAEREAVSRAMDGYIAWMEDNVALDRPDVQADLYRLRGLLERLK